MGYARLTRFAGKLNLFREGHLYPEDASVETKEELQDLLKLRMWEFYWAREALACWPDWKKALGAAGIDLTKKTACDLDVSALDEELVMCVVYRCCLWFEYDHWVLEDERVADLLERCVARLAEFDSRDEEEQRRLASIAEVTQDDIDAVERRFRDLIRDRAGWYGSSWAKLEDHQMPGIDAAEINDGHCGWVSVTRMYGGFKYRLDTEQGVLTLRSTSWSRVWGLGQVHVITPTSTELVEEFQA